MDPWIQMLFDADLRNTMPYFRDIAGELTVEGLLYEYWRSATPFVVVNIPDECH